MLWCHNSNHTLNRHSSLLYNCVNFNLPVSEDGADVLLIAMAGSHQIWAYCLTEVEWWKNVYVFLFSYCFFIFSSGVLLTFVAITVMYATIPLNIQKKTSDVSA